MKEEILKWQSIFLKEKGVRTAESTIIIHTGHPVLNKKFAISGNGRLIMHWGEDDHEVTIVDMDNIDGLIAGLMLLKAIWENG